MGSSAGSEGMGCGYSILIHLQSRGRPWVAVNAVRGRAPLYADVQTCRCIGLRNRRRTVTNAIMTAWQCGFMRGALGVARAGIRGSTRLDRRLVEGRHRPGRFILGSSRTDT